MTASPFSLVPPGTFPPRRRPKPRKRWICPDDKAQVDCTVYIALPHSPSEPATLQSVPGVKACRECHRIFNLNRPKNGEQP